MTTVEERIEAAQELKRRGLLSEAELADLDSVLQSRPKKEVSTKSRVITREEQTRDPRAPAPSGNPLAEGARAATRKFVNTIGGSVAAVADNVPNQIIKRRITAATLGVDPKDLKIPGDFAQKGIEKLGIRLDPKQNPTSAERALTKGGESFGTSAAFIAGPGAKIKGIANVLKNVPFVGPRLGKLLAPIVKKRVERPLSFFATDLGLASGAAQGAIGAEVVAPGNVGAGVLAEVLGGFFNPTATVARLVPNALGGLNSLAKSFTRAGQKEAAASFLQKVVIKNGGDPADVARILRVAEEAGVNLTVGVKSGDDAMLALERVVGQSNDKFTSLSAKQTEDSLQALRELTENLRKSGDADAIILAAQAEAHTFQTMLDDLVEAAEKEVRLSIAPLKAGGREAGDSGLRMRRIMDVALRRTKRVEDKYWAQVPRRVRTEPIQLAKQMEEIVKNDTISGGLPIPNARAIINLMDNAQTTSGDMLIMRSELLEMGRKAGVAGSFRTQRMANKLAAAVAKDLEQTGIEATRASNFTAAKNEAFQRSFVGTALSTGKRGDVIPADQLMERAFRGGNIVTTGRNKALAGAARTGDQARGDMERNIMQRLVGEEQDAFLRAAAEEVFEDVPDATGKIVQRANTRKLATFMKNNADVIERNPSLKAEFDNIGDAETAMQAALKRVQHESTVGRRQKAFSQFMDQESGPSVVAKILAGAEPERMINETADMAARAGPAALEGLGSSLLSVVVKRSTSGKTGKFSFELMQRNLDTPFREGGETIGTIIQKRKLMDPDSYARYRQLLKRGAEIEQNVARRANLGTEGLPRPDEGLTDLILRIAGSNIGAKAGSNAGSQLVVAGAASRLARRWGQKIPFSRINEVIEEAARNPKFMAALLERPRSPSHAREIQSQLNAFLGSAFITDEEQ